MGQTRSFGDVGSMSGLPDSGHGRRASQANSGGRARTRAEPPLAGAHHGAPASRALDAWPTRRQEKKISASGENFRALNLRAGGAASLRDLVFSDPPPGPASKRMSAMPPIARRSMRRSEPSR